MKSETDCGDGEKWESEIKNLVFMSVHSYYLPIWDNLIIFAWREFWLREKKPCTSSVQSIRLEHPFLFLPALHHPCIHFWMALVMLVKYSNRNVKIKNSETSKEKANQCSSCAQSSGSRFFSTEQNLSTKTAPSTLECKLSFRLISTKNP